MKKYSGNASFEFEVERYKNKITSELTAEDMSDNEEMFDYITVKLQVEGSSYFSPGRTYGEPGDCYPDEGETEISSVMGPNKEDWEEKLSDKEHDQIIEMIEEKCMDDGPDPDDYDDRDDYDPGDHYEYEC